MDKNCKHGERYKSIVAELVKNEDKYRKELSFVVNGANPIAKIKEGFSVKESTESIPIRVSDGTNWYNTNTYAKKCSMGLINIPTNPQIQTSVLHITKPLYEALKIFKNYSDICFEPKEEIVQNTDVLNCAKCKIQNEYAESNQADGSYICYNCR